MIDARNFYIDGQWVEPVSTNEFPILSPVTEEQIGVTILGNEEDVDKAVGAAVQAFELFSSTKKKDRLRLLEKLLQVTKARFEDLAWAMTTEMGAPISMSRDSQADSGIGHLEGFISSLKEQVERETLTNGDILIREPIGVCGLITPWNWTVNQIALKDIPALATG